MLLIRRKKTVEKINGRNNSTYSENTDLDIRAIHIHGGMEHNLDGYAKYYSCGSIKITKKMNSQEKLITVKEIFLDIGK